MANTIKTFTIFLLLILFNYSCKGQNSNQNENLPKEQATILIPFLPGSCHQCNADFYGNLRKLEAKKIEYSILLSEDYSDDLDYIKKEYNLSKFKVKTFLFSSALYETYHIYEQNYVLQFGIDSNFKVYDNTEALIKDLEILNDAERVKPEGYSFKKSTANIIVNGKDQLCVRNSVRQSAFDFIDLKNKKKPLSISFTQEQLLNNYVLNFKDPAIARNKLNEINNIKDIPNKNTFDQAIFQNDSLFMFSNHTYINSLVDSSLGGFMILNIYKDGIYSGSRSISKEGVPDIYSFLPHFYIYNNKLYIELVKEKIETDKPNYFLGMFELENGVYQFRKMLSFTVPAIHNDVGYSFLELKFSGKYFMTSISNILFNLETEQMEPLNIPINKKFVFQNLINNLKGVDIVIDNINVQYPNLLITYFYKDDKGIGNNVVLQYNMEAKNITGRIKFPLDNPRFIKPDLTHFGYFIWVPEKGNNDYLIYKKLY